jgi:uncharacterized protein
VPDYLDSSAFVKLIRSDPESSALRGDLSGDEIVSSALLVVEGRRAAARYGQLATARTLVALTAITLLPIDDQVLRIAADLDPPELRSLDAVHLATVLSLGAELDRFYCYGNRLADAARKLGIQVSQPS